MPRERLTIRVLGVAALLVAALGLGVFLGSPNAAVAQEDTTTTVLENESTDTTVTESTEESDETDRPARADHDCGDRSDGSSYEDSSQSDS